jgi:hypothetical protein
MPRRIAFFVEGQTESIFLPELLREYLPVNSNLHVTRKRQHGEAMFEVSVRGPQPLFAEFEVLIVDCGCDDKVLSYALDQLPYLHNVGYESLTLLRDLYPLTAGDHAGLLQNAVEELNSAPIPTELHIAIREIEAWFLGDVAVLQRMDAVLTRQFVEANANILISPGMVESIPHPAALLDHIFGRIGLRYKKSEDEVWSLVSKLDYVTLLAESAVQIPSLSKFLNRIDCVFADQSS